MSKKANHISTHDSLTDIIKAGEKAGPKFQADANADIIAKGDDIVNKKNTAKTKQDMVASLEVQLATAVIEQTDAEDALVNSYNSGVDKANEVYPHNEDKLTGLGLTLSKDGTPVATPSIVVGCSAVQSEHSGKANMHWHSLKGVRTFMVMETTTETSNLMDETKYYPANPASFLTSKGGEVTPKDLTKITWWRVYGVNASGNGVWSAPFGGFIVQ